MPQKRKFLTNKKGERISVVIDIEDYRKMLEDLEELDSIRAYDAAKSSAGHPVPFRQAIEEIERSRK